MKTKTRFAPSPTGGLHLGGARTALFNWAWARKNAGEFVLRIEDTDTERSRTEWTQEIQESLRWLGLDWDGEPVIQSQRIARHQVLAQQLLAQGKAYRCHMARDAGREEGNEGSQRVSPWRPESGKMIPPAPEGSVGVIRFLAPREGFVAWKDGAKGKISIPSAQVEDFALLRENGTPTYNLAVAADDWDMGITDVIRGDDHVNNTPKQILLLQAWGAPIPSYTHAPMILGPDGEKLSKRNGAQSAIALRGEGILPQALLNALARLSWGHKSNMEAFSMEDFKSLFDPKQISPNASRFDKEKLLWLNREHMKRLGAKGCAPLWPGWIERAANQGSAQEALEKLAAIWPALTSRCKTFLEMEEELRAIEEPKGAACFFRLAQSAREEWAALEMWTPENIQEAAKRACAKTPGTKIGDLMMPLRGLLFARQKTLPMDMALFWAGKEKTMAALETFVLEAAPEAQSKAKPKA